MFSHDISSRASFPTKHKMRGTVSVGNRRVISFFLPTSLDPVLQCAGRKRRAEQELGQWVLIACWKSGDLGSFPYSLMDILSEILCLSLLLCNSIYSHAKMLSEMESKYLEKLVMFQQDCCI